MATEGEKTIPYTLTYMDWALAVPRGQERALRVLMALIRHANKKAVCWPSQSTIAAVAFGIDREEVKPHHREQVRRALVWLRENGFVTYGHNPIKKATVYRLQDPSIPATTAGTTPATVKGGIPATVEGGPRHSEGEDPRHSEGPKEQGNSHGEDPEEESGTGIGLAALGATPLRRSRHPRTTGSAEFERLRAKVLAKARAQ